MADKYKNEEEMLELVRSFEAGTISRDKWKHAEHLTVALYYVSQHDLETATGKMRSGIHNLLYSFGVDLAREMPYHETLTVFWMQTVNDFNSSNNGTSLLEKTNILVKEFDKDYALRFYCRDRLFSEQARKRFIEPSSDGTAEKQE